jgi:hypothetical protein
VALAHPYQRPWQQRGRRGGEDPDEDTRPRATGQTRQCLLGLPCQREQTHRVVGEQVTASVSCTRRPTCVNSSVLTDRCRAAICCETAPVVYPRAAAAAVMLPAARTSTRVLA